jgi:hypothetical protein
MADSADTLDRRHPIASAVAQIDDILKTIRDAPAWSMGSEETRRTLVETTHLEAKVAELQARMAEHARTIEVEAVNGATSTANWRAHETKQTRAAAHRKTKLARALNSELHEPVRTALADGRLLVDQAEVIVQAIDALPADLVDDEVRRDAQATLIRYAAQYDAKHLRILGKRILEVVAPEVGDAWEAKQLAQEEREAEAAAVFWMHDDGHGKTHVRFTIPTAYGEMLRRALMAIAAPKHRTQVDGEAPEPGRPSAQRMGQAFCEFIAGYPAADLPHARRRQRHRGRHHGHRDAAGWTQGGPAGHRRPDLAGPGPPTRLPGGHHPGRTRLEFAGAGPGQEDPVLHRTTTHRVDAPAGRLHRGGL